MSNFRFVQSGSKFAQVFQNLKNEQLVSKVLWRSKLKKQKNGKFWPFLKKICNILIYIILIFQDEEDLQPSASLASKTDTVFVSVNYRRGVLGFLSLQSLSDK